MVPYYHPLYGQCFTLAKCADYYQLSEEEQMYPLRSFSVEVDFNAILPDLLASKCKIYTCVQPFQPYDFRAKVLNSEQNRSRQRPR